MKNFIQGMLGLIVALVAIHSNRSHALTIREAVDLATIANPDLKIAREKVRELDYQTQVYRRSLFPSLSAYSRSYVKKDAVLLQSAIFGGDPYDSFDYGLQLVFPIFKGAGSWSQVAKARKDEQIAQLTAGIAQRDLVVKVLTSFYSILLAQEKIQTFERRQTILDRFLGVARTRLSNGSEKRATVLQFRTDLALNLPQIQAARNELVLAGTTLASLMNERDVTVLQVKGALKEDQLAAFAERCLTTTRYGERPEIQRAQAQLDQLADIRSVVMAPYWPALNVLASWSRNSTKFSDLLSPGATQWSAGFEFTIPVFAGFASIPQRRVLAEQKTGLQLTRHSIENNMALERAKNAKSIELLEAQMRSTAEALSLARATFDQIERDYRLGVEAYTQVYDAQTKLVSAELSHQQTVYDLFSALVQYYVVNSIDLEPFVQGLSEAQ